jgi:oligoendopeptidase F
MSREQEMLATDLNVNGLHAWGRLYDTITGRLEFELEWPEGHEKAGQKEKFPISQWRSLMGSRDRKVGRAAFEGGNRAWAGIETTCASALNAIAGSRFTLNKYRGIDHYLDRALFQSRITKDSLDAMYTAIWDNIDVARDIFRAKAGTMGRSGIYWFEREAPLDVDDSKTYSWEEGVNMVTAAFQKAYPSLADYYEGFLAKRWLESEPRPGKRPGAYCTGSEYNREQRVYMTYNGAIGDVTTMAHEVGHAWHGHLLKDMRPLATSYPMTLAETASIFAEHILAEGIYSDDDISAPQKLGMLDADLCGAATLLLDITVRFEFEKAFHEERQHGEVSVGRLKELMVETQRRVMGDALMEDGVDPYFWASKLHFYISGVTFYNFPYTFGFLLARTLFMLFKERGESFLPEYEDFLRLTGSDTVENVARRTIDADTTDPAFWSKAITSLKEPLAQYKELLKKV